MSQADFRELEVAIASRADAGVDSALSDEGDEILAPDWIVLPDGRPGPEPDGRSTSEPHVSRAARSS